jgi:hypothetical protein
MNKSISIEEALHVLEAENQKFANHWLWKELHCEPQEFFQAFEHHLRALRIPSDKWERALERTRAASRIRAKEKQLNQDSCPLPLVQGMRV